MSPNWFSTPKVSPCFKMRVRGSRSAPVASIRNWDSSSVAPASSGAATAMMASLPQTLVGSLCHAGGARRSGAECSGGQNLVIDPKIVARHPLRRKALLEAPADRRPIKLSCKRNRRHRRIDRIDDETGQAIFDDLGHRTATEGDHRSAVRHRLDQHQAERLGPVDREQQRQRVAKEAPLVGFADLADKFDQWILQ